MDPELLMNWNPVKLKNSKMPKSFIADKEVNLTRKKPLHVIKYRNNKTFMIYFVLKNINNFFQTSNFVDFN